MTLSVNGREVMCQTGSALSGYIWEQLFMHLGGCFLEYLCSDEFLPGKRLNKNEEENNG